MSAGILLGGRYGIAEQRGKYDGVSTAKDDRRPWGAGLTAGYAFEGFRVVGSIDDFDKKKKATLATIGAHMIDSDDEFIRGFLGFDVGRLTYRHKIAPKSEDVTIGGLSIGIILLDDRFPSMQMEIAYRYLKRFGSLPDNVKINDVQHAYIGLSFDLNLF
jgi:hypothetical protein